MILAVALHAGLLVGCTQAPDEVKLLFPSENKNAVHAEKAKQLGGLLEDRIGMPVEVVGYESVNEVFVSLSEGQGIVVGGLTPLEMVLAEQRNDARLLLQETQSGLRFTATQWFTNSPETFCSDRVVADDEGYLYCNDVLGSDMGNGPYGSEMLELVEGQIVAFVRADSVGAYAIPSIQLLDQGVDPLTGIEGFFTGGHDESVLAVYEDRAVVGVSNIDARPSIADEHPDVGQEVVVFAWSGPIPFGGFIASWDLSSELGEVIQQTFISIGGTEEGAELIGAVYGYEGVIPAVSSDYGAIRDVATELGDLFE